MINKAGEFVEREERASGERDTCTERECKERQ